MLSDEGLLWADAVFVSGMLVQAPSVLEVVEARETFGRRTVVGGPACTTSATTSVALDGDAHPGTGAAKRATWLQ